MIDRGPGRDRGLETDPEPDEENSDAERQFSNSASQAAFGRSGKTLPD
jgi:hypothetical protein